MTDPRKALLPKIFGPILGLLILVILAIVIAIFYLRGPSDFSDNYRQSTLNNNEDLMHTQSPLQRLQSIRANRMASELATTSSSAESLNVSSEMNSSTFTETNGSSEAIETVENIELQKRKGASQLLNSQIETSTIRLLSATNEPQEFLKFLVDYFYGSKNDETHQGFVPQRVHPPFSFLP